MPVDFCVVHHGGAAFDVDQSRLAAFSAGANFDGRRQSIRQRFFDRGCQLRSSAVQAAVEEHRDARRATGIDQPVEYLRPLVEDAFFKNNWIGEWNCE